MREQVGCEYKPGEKALSGANCLILQELNETPPSLTSLSKEPPAGSARSAFLGKSFSFLLDELWRAGISQHPPD